eukprot:1892598-Rhodomonas_salina.1
MASRWHSLTHTLTHSLGVSRTSYRSSATRQLTHSLTRSLTCEALRLLNVTVNCKATDTRLLQRSHGSCRGAHYFLTAHPRAIQFA